MKLMNLFMVMLLLTGRAVLAETSSVTDREWLKQQAVCYEYPSPIIPKERWRYQMVNMYPDSGQCHPLGRSVMRWEAGKNPPNTRKNYGYLMWRKRNCVFL